MDTCIDSGTKYLFNFPYKPYSIQEDLMNKIEQTLREKKIGIFSSPTGTGKSLSIICSTFYFIEKLLEDEENAVKEKISAGKLEIGELDANCQDDWITSHSKKRDISEKLLNIKNELDKFEKFHARNRQIKEQLHKRQSFLSESTTINRKQKKLKPGNDECVDDETCNEEIKDIHLITDEDEDEDNLEEGKENIEEEDDIVKPKIIYSSRTHSQLAQFVNEIKKTVYADRIRVVSLGSRVNLCVNPSVKSAKSSNLVNDKCLEMQRSKSSKCSYLKRSNMEEIRDDILGLVQDIEDVYKLGCAAKACAYYASRMAVRETQVLVVPYNILIHPQTRASFGIDIQDNIVVIDEAHNLLDTIASIHGVLVTGGQIIDSLSQLNQYMIKYSRRLAPANLMMIKQLLFILGCFVRLFKEIPQKNNGQYEIFSATELLMRINAQDFNIFQLLNFCEKSQIARKLFGFSATVQLDSNNKPDDNNDQSKPTVGTLAFLAKLKQDQKDSKKVKPKKQPKKIKTSPDPITQEEEPKVLSSPLYQVIELFRCLTSQQGEGRFLWTRNADDVRLSTLKFVLLNPAHQFEDIVKKCRSLVLIGGTMEPTSEFVDLLFEPLGITQQSIISFSCDHVIPGENILPLCLGRGPKGKNSMQFTFKTRSDPELYKNVAEILLDIGPCIPGGIIVFFPSYDYENTFYNNWSKNKLVSLIEVKTKKKIFREPKNGNQVSKLLLNYSKAIDSMTKGSSTGAILLSVVGGKMSEGINFGDNLGRCVIMVGLPYANMYSPELKEKMVYLASRQKGLDEMYYENLCIKSVNQSVGRVIRHQNDYACIIFLDQRYCDKASIRDNLPKWIQKRLKISHQYDTGSCLIRKFFQTKCNQIIKGT